MCSLRPPGVSGISWAEFQHRGNGNAVLNIASLETVCDTVLSVEFIDQIGL